MYFIIIVVVISFPEKESESEVTQLCPIVYDPMECSLSGSSVHGIFQAIVLEWIARDKAKEGEDKK